VTLDSDLEARLIETQWNSSEKQQWQLTSFIPSKDYIAALITNAEVNHIEYFNWQH